MMLALLYDYRTNPGLYPEWQRYFRDHQPPTLIVWGKNDVIFPASGAYPYQKDLKNVDFNLLDAGHFALEDHADFIAARIRAFADFQCLTSPRRNCDADHDIEFAANAYFEPDLLQQLLVCRPNAGRGIFSMYVRLAACDKVRGFSR